MIDTSQMEEIPDYQSKPTAYETELDQSSRRFMNLLGNISKVKKSGLDEPLLNKETDTSQTNPASNSDNSDT